MLQNPYRSPADASSSSTQADEHSLYLEIFRVAGIVGSGIVMLLGGGAICLGFIAADGRNYFLLFGLHLLLSGGFGAILAWTRGRGWLRWTSVILNGLVAISIAMLIYGGTLRGPMILVAPIVLGLPAICNVLFAVLSLPSKQSLRSSD